LNVTFTSHGSMNMQIIHSHQLRDPLVDDHTLTWLVTRWFV